MTTTHVHFEDSLRDGNGREEIGPSLDYPEGVQITYSSLRDCRDGSIIAELREDGLWEWDGRTWSDIVIAAMESETNRKLFDLLAEAAEPPGGMRPETYASWRVRALAALTEIDGLDRSDAAIIRRNLRGSES